MDWRSAINGFRQYLQLERSLATNSVLAYIMDVEKLLSFSITQDISDPSKINTRHVQLFLKWLSELEVSATSDRKVYPLICRGLWIGEVLSMVLGNICSSSDRWLQTLFWPI